MEESDRFLNAIGELDEVTGSLSPDEARATFDETTLQVFWRDWTRISQWAGALWRTLNEDLELPARQAVDPDDETGVAG